MSNLPTSNLVVVSGTPGINPVEQAQLATVVDRLQVRQQFKVKRPGPPPLSLTETRRLANRAFRHARWHRESFLDALDAISRAVRLLDDDTLADLVWRGQQSAGDDGYGSSGLAEKVSGAGGDVKLTSVEAAVEGRIEAPIRDSAGVAVRDLMAALWECSNLSAVIDRCSATLLYIHDPAGDDDSPIVCAGCSKVIGKATRAHRIDGQPYHAEGSPNCYQAENRRRRDNGTKPQVVDMSDNDLIPLVVGEPPCPPSEVSREVVTGGFRAGEGEWSA